MLGFKRRNGRFRRVEVDWALEELNLLSRVLFVPIGNKRSKERGAGAGSRASGPADRASKSAARGPFSDPLAFMAVGLGDILVFAGFIGAGLLFRRRPEVHKRLMVLGTLGGLMWPAITRIPHVAGKFPLMFALFALLVFAFAARDWVLARRAHSVSLWGGVLILATVPARTVIAHTALWHRLAEFLVR